MGTVTTLVVAAILAFFGFALGKSGLNLVMRWNEVSPWLGLVAILWSLAGAGMLASAGWMLATRGRQRLPFRIGGAGAALAGGSLVIGVLTFVVPCAGPS